MIEVGKQAPDFELTSHWGDKFTLNQFKGQKNVMLVLFAGLDTVWLDYAGHCPSRGAARAKKNPGAACLQLLPTSA